MPPNARAVGSIPVYRAAVGFFRAFFRLTGGIRAVRPELVPDEGGLIVAAVHLSHLDPPALACTMPRRRLLAMAKEELWRNRAFGAIIGAIGAYPIRRGETDREGLQWCLDRLTEGQALLVFPEGTRGDGSRLGEIEPGAGLLARRTGARVIPVGIVGTHRLLPVGGGFRRGHRVTVVYGEPFAWSDVATGASERENRRLFADRLRADLRRLCAEGGLDLS